MPVSAEIGGGLEARRELAEETQHRGQALGTVFRDGLLQEQGRMHGNNLGPVLTSVTYSQGIQINASKYFTKKENAVPCIFWRSEEPP